MQFKEFLETVNYLISFLLKASDRNHDECSICMNTYKLPSEISRKSCYITTNNTETCTHKPLVLLSCSHVFHNVCLRTFEELNFDNLPVCPECRSAYKKLEL